MPINFSDKVYAVAQEVFGRPIIVTPLKSQPGQPAYGATGIYGTEPIDVLAEEGIFSDARTIVDILEKNFSVLPVQGDYISIPADSGLPAEGDFVVIDVMRNGGGETTLNVQKLVAPKP